MLDAVRGLGHAMHTVACVGLMIDPRDLGFTLGDREGDDGPPGKDGAGGGGPLFDPTIFLYDHVAGGIGLAPRIFEERDALLRRTRKLLEGCSCAHGCPACVGPAIGSDGSRPLRDERRKLAIEILSHAGIGAEH